MEKAVHDGWRYLRLTPDRIYAMTPREFTLLTDAEKVRRDDKQELQAVYALWREKAHRAKRPKLSDLFVHPEKSAELEDKAEKAQEAQSWLSKINFGGRR